MLSTVLHIGKIFRASKRLNHHRFIKTAPKHTEKEPVIYLSLPLDGDFKIDFEKLSKIPEVKQRNFYYLTFKTSGADSLVKYLFGDICYGTKINKKTKEVKEIGYYKMGDPNVKAKGFQVSSFFRCLEDAMYFKDTAIEKFRNSFKNNVQQIESILKDNSVDKTVFLHFDFEGKHWYEFENELQQINNKMFSDILSYSEKGGGYQLEKFLYKTLGSTTPNFDETAKFKNKCFQTTEEFLDLIYAIDYSQKASIVDRNVKIVILPKGKNMTSDDIETFFESKSGIEDEKISNAENTLANLNELDSIFKPVTSAVIPKSITQFDFVFSKKGNGASSPDVDMIEISGISKSHLSVLSNRIQTIRLSVVEMLSKELMISEENCRLSIKNSFLELLCNLVIDKKKKVIKVKNQSKYQNHLFRVLPKIYTGTYHQDPILLPAFIDKVEYHLRNDTDYFSFNIFKYDFFFLTKIQNTSKDLIMELKNSTSYKIGQLLGKMAKPLGQGKNAKIASFEKNYIGLLSRRIADLKDVVAFSNYINEKLAIHEIKYLQKESVGVSILLHELNEVTYQKNECAFGFFEGYFTYCGTPDADNTQESNQDNN